MKRRDKILQPVGDELLFYDPQNRECSLLSAEAKYIWELAQKGDTKIEVTFCERFPQWQDQAEEIVEETLKQLKALELIDSSLPGSSQERRQFLKVGALTLFSSAIAPLPTAAASNRLVVVSAVYTGPASVAQCGPIAGSGPCTAPDFTTEFNARITANGGNLLRYETWPAPGVTAFSLPTSDPCSGTKKVLSVRYRCNNGVIQTRDTCDTHTVTSISCP